MAALNGSVSWLLAAALTTGAPGVPGAGAGTGPAAVAQVQALLALDGRLPAGAVTGRLGSATGQALVQALWAAGAGSWEAGLARAAGAGPEPAAARTWLAAWGLNGPQALGRFQAAVGLPADGHWNAATAGLLAHLEAVRLAYRHHWAYRAQAGDSFSRLAWAAGIPVSRLMAANPAHGSRLWVGQAVTWPGAAPPPAAPPAAPGEGETPASSGPFGHLEPAGAVVLMAPGTDTLRALLAAERGGFRHLRPDIAVSGQYLLLHPRLLRALVAEGNAIDVIGYTGLPLSGLTPKETTQEIQWAVTAGERVLGTPPAALVLPAPDGAAAAAARRAGLPVAVPRLTVRGAAAAARLTAARIAAAQAAAWVQPPVTASAWRRWMAALARRHAVLLSLAQQWDAGAGSN
ncbi:putative NodB homology domain-containing protein [Candidatus Hydrogenisulfobacillus filiaventi]|uniref:Putative NodB homology domain-containing protein n=1 Tax=Candidatus Hydrogenisulfobacillus filiaventi TaxID=2707344 RepID=A0A6F8ZFN5_9FIRM|nr:LysM peptidoglycan-binding domain-containing protein [Bacillota bacterium]CAB1128744.1 putative NodB homology domain-containing protein [Candidatus Hydrogenisulfobacillus filiaventi]